MPSAMSGENIKLIRPLSHQLCKVVLSVLSPILSHNIILNLVVQWPKFGHSTISNDKGYQAHKQMGHIL